MIPLWVVVLLCMLFGAAGLILGACLHVAKQSDDAIERARIYAQGWAAGWRMAESPAPGSAPKIIRNSGGAL